MIAAIGGRRFEWGSRTYVMGIINVTPDSFSGDGIGGDEAAAVSQGLRMVSEGADMLDIGGESTRPGHQPITAAEEIARTEAQGSGELPGALSQPHQIAFAAQSLVEELGHEGPSLVVGSATSCRRAPWGAGSLYQS